MNKERVSKLTRIVINGGYIIDPANKIASKLNIAIENGKIVEISNKVLEGDRCINAKGQIVAPGFIDCHMHEDPYHIEEDMFDISILECMLKMGITTAIGGNCGVGPSDIPKYMEAVDRIGIPINLSLLLPHGTLRRLVSLDNKYEPATEDQIKRMRETAEEYLGLGLLGISYGIRYIPGLNTDELMEISSTCKKDNKIVAAHIRDDAKNVIPALEELISIGQELDIPIQVSHIGSMAAYGQMDEFLSLVDYHSTNGMDISMDCYPYNAFSTGIGQTTYDDGFLERYNIDYDSIEIAEGKYRGLRCTESIFNELRENAPETITIGHVMNEEDVDKAISHPNVMIASDGLMNNFQGHPRAAGTFPRLISEYVKNKKILSLYEAIEKITYLPAKRFGINKGTLSINADADIVIFNFDEIKDNSTFDEPALAPDGIKYVIIDGKIVVKDNELIDRHSGRMVRA